MHRPPQWRSTRGIFRSQRFCGRSCAPSRRRRRLAPALPPHPFPPALLLSLSRLALAPNAPNALGKASIDGRTTSECFLPHRRGDDPDGRSGSHDPCTRVAGAGLLRPEARRWDAVARVASGPSRPVELLGPRVPPLQDRDARAREDPPPLRRPGAARDRHHRDGSITPAGARGPLEQAPRIDEALLARSLALVRARD